MASIRLHNLRKTFGNVVAVHSLSLSIADGEFAALLGPSGCGKTTTMNMIAGLETPTAGDIFFGDKRVNDVPPDRRGVGFVFQNYAIFTHMTVAENIGFGLRVQRRPPDEIRREVHKVAELLDITHLLTTRAGKLSINDMQKVAIGRSMIMKPRIFLLDEPFSNLDGSFRFYMRGELKRLQREIGQTMIYVTHDQVEAMSMADKIAVMDFGVLQQFGTPDEIYNTPANLFVANFIGSPSMNFVRCRYCQENGQGYLVQQEGPARLVLDARRRHLLAQRHRADDLVLGIRPEFIHASPTMSAAEPETAWPGRVVFLEPLGARTIVHVRVGADTLQVAAPADYRPALDAPQWLTLDPRFLHVFDAQSGLAIR